MGLSCFVLESIIADKSLVEKRLSLVKYPRFASSTISFYVRILVSLVKGFKSVFIIFQTRHFFPQYPAMQHLLRALHGRSTVLRAEATEMSEMQSCPRDLLQLPPPRQVQ